MPKLWNDLKIITIFFKKIYPLDFDRDDLINEQLPLSMNFNSTVSPCTEVIIDIITVIIFYRLIKISNFFPGIIAN
jgi:hypothetical protein